jgi:hypothetical protein
MIEAATGADLGGSSKYSMENFDPRAGTCTKPAPSYNPHKKARAGGNVAKTRLKSAL